MTTNLKLSLLSLLPLLAINSHASEFEWSDLGLRVGIDAENRVNMESYELVAHLDSPWSWTVDDNFEIDLGFDFGLGLLEGEGEAGLLTHIGPSIKLPIAQLPLEFALSSGPALLSEHEFDTLDLGGTFQFFSAVGFDYAITEDWMLGYRWLHISNAGLHDENPGMNLHAFSAFYAF
ncbi:MAG: acyloxyacyl hydrolase [Opitutales bacterium]